MAALQKTWSGDLTWSIAKNLYAASRTADAYRQESKDIIGPEVDDHMLRRGEFFGHALGAKATGWLPRRFQHQMPDIRGSEYLMRGQRRSLMSPFASPINPQPTTPWNGGGSGGGGGINPEVVPNDTILGKMINITPTAGRSGGIVVHDQKLGKFVSAVAESLSASMNSMNTKADGIDQGVIAAKDGLTATQQQLEEVGGTLEDKLDAIIAEIRGQNSLLRKQEDEEEVAKQENKLEQQDITEAEKSGTDRLAGVNEKVDDVLAENQAEDAAEIASQQQLMLPPAQEREEGGKGYNTIMHGKERDNLTGKIFDGPDTGYKANTSGDITPINNFFTRGQTGAASKTGGLPKSAPVKTGRVQSLVNIPEIKKETDKLSKAAVLPVQASGAMTLGILGQSMGQMDGLAGEKGVETGIKKIAAPIAGMFGVKNSIANNVAGEVGSAADAAKRAASTAAGDAIKEGPFQGVFNALGNTVNWVKSLFAEKPQAEKGGYVKSSSNMVSISAEKGAVINGPKTGYPVNIGGATIEAHGKERVEKVSQGIQITPLDNFATDGIQGNEVTPGGDLNLSSNMSFERGGRLTPSRIREQRAQQAAMNAPSSNKTDIVQLNSKEREFNRMLTKVTKIDPVVINSTNSKTDPPPQEMQHIANKGDCALDLIYPPLV